MAQRKTGQAKKSGGASARNRRGSGSKSGTSKSTRSSSARKSTATKSTAKKSTAKKTTAKKSGASKSSASRSRSSSAGADLSSKNVAELRDALQQSVIRPLDLVMLTRERIEEVVDEAVERGRMTADDAQDLVGGLVQRGRKQTNDVLGDLEQLLGRGRDEIDGRRTKARKRGTDAARAARKQVEDATTRARKQAVKTADPVLAQADRARRAAGLGPSFPVTSYDDLTVAQVQSRIADLTAPELRKVRDYERRHANRKTVLNAIGEKLS
jgi:polyhydroxyalkanoate synthesis regulator phasin